jgi:hypothetical protein
MLHVLKILLVVLLCVLMAIINDMLEDRQGQLWISTEGSGLPNNKVYSMSVGPGEGTWQGSGLRIKWRSAAAENPRQPR